MFTKQHYEVTAKIIKDHDDTYGGKTTIAFDFAEYFKKDNPSFDWEKFMKACGVTVRTA